ncbi:MAG: hypothetical protein QOE11_2133 [Solirubrobacteraceae bacterium]|nr:hypothetical protein [Solirubrobacteraceae bacterium]
MRLRGALLTARAGVVLVVLVFLAISAWWLATDLRMVNLDNGKHLLIAVRYYQEFVTGRVFMPLTSFEFYPPLVHIVGAISSLLIGRPTIFGSVLAENLVFVPLLACGCYGAARVTFGPAAGLLAAVFAFAVPMLMSMFHVFLVDAPEAAMVAMTVWLLLASDRFDRVGVAAGAGAMAGLGMYTKGTFVMFVLGIVAMMLLRGGWRNWKGFLAFGVIGSLLAGPWYIGHYGDLHGQTYGAIASGAAIWYDNIPFPARWSQHNFTWYGWDLLNNQLYLPLTLFFVIGAGWSLWQLRRRSAWKDSLLPELIAGGFVGYFLISLLVLKDPRYSLPCLVYIAVVATGWIVHMPRRVRVGATALLVAIFVVNTVNHNFGVGGVHVITTPWSINSPNGEYKAVLLNQAGFFEGGPDRRAAPFLDLLKGVRRAGPNVVFDAANMSSGGYNISALTLFAFKARLVLLSFDPAAVKKGDAWVTRAIIKDVGRPPCIVSPLADDGTGIYVYRGRVPADLRRAQPDCPPA